MIRRANPVGSTLLALLLLLAAAPAAPAALPQGYPPPVKRDVLPKRICDGESSTRLTIRCLLNHLRKTHGRPKLKPHAALQRAADRYARRMSERGFFGHVEPNGDRIAQRIEAVSRWKDWRWVGEIISWTCIEHSEPREVVNAWWASPAHRRMILDRRSRRIGLGVAGGTPFKCDGMTWAVEVGVRF